MDVLTFDEDGYGYLSHGWMLRRLAENVPRERLDRGVNALIGYLLYVDTADPKTALDILAQMISTGTYIPTIHIPDAEDKTTGFTEENIIQFKDYLDRLPDGDGGDAA